MEIGAGSDACDGDGVGHWIAYMPRRRENPRLHAPQPRPHPRQDPRYADDAASQARNVRWLRVGFTTEV